jgi:putative hydrolases of HD superfamily
MDKELVLAIEKLKEVKRKGWVDSGIPNAESVADHTCSVALCVLFMGMERKDIDLKKALTMALIHDLAESVVGDITPYDGVSKKDKLTKEEKALRNLLKDLPKDGQKHLLDLWKEMESGKSPEAKLVLQADIFDRVVQANNYRNKGHDVDRFFHAINELRGSDFEKTLQSVFKRSSP